jgi:tetratricopeptide (TPR) repeat protein
VPMDSLWRTGASNATTISCNEEIIFGDKTLAAGRYALFTIPSKNNWTVIVNTDTTLHGSSGYDSKKDVFRFTVPVGKISAFYETFTIELNDINDKGEGFLKIIWENTLVKIAIKSKADEKIMALIQKHIVEDKMQDAELLFQAASYYYVTKRDSKLAVKWLNDAEKLDAENFYYPNLRQKILADLKDYPAAVEAAKKAIVLGEKKKMTNTVNNLKKRITGWELLVNKK